MGNKAARRGFTIVELLIVIVVIGILSSISVVAYKGAQTRAHDSAVQSDLQSLVSAAELYRLESNEYPNPMLREMGFKATKESYDTTNTSHNLLHCYNDDPTTNLIVIARSKSGNAFYVTNEQQTPTPFTGAWIEDPMPMCESLDPDIDYYWRGWVRSSSPQWRDWTG